MFQTALYVVSLICVFGCGEADRIPADAPGYVKGKAVHPTIKIGKPYRVMGNKYYPEYDPDYVEEGIASWYGPNFHGKMTANGEKYNQWAMTAAHTTLPMPSMVRVTALDTGRSIVVRVNDRGPFADGRIIDLSRAAAEELGTRAKGLARVRVEYLKEETEAYIAKLQLKKPDSWKEKDIMIAKAEPEQAAEIVSARVSPPLSEPVMVSEDGVAHEVSEAEDVPEQFAYETPELLETTVSARGVTMEEIGYAEDAFSVLDEADFEPRERADPPFFASSANAAPLSASPETPSEWRSGSSFVRFDPTPLSSTPAKPAAKPLYVRAGTFAERSNARKLAEKLRAITDTQVIPTSGGSQTLYKVVLGPAFNRGIAEAIREKLPRYGIRDAVITSQP